jgi:hypothetical protein
MAAAAPMAPLVPMPRQTTTVYEIQGTEQNGCLSQLIYDTDKQHPKGWISRATYDSLPPIFQASARDLVKKGRIEIEDLPGQPAEAQRNENTHPVKG